MAFKCLRGLAPDYLAKKCKTRSEIHSRDTRLPAGQKTFHNRPVSLWNALPERLTNLTNIVTFKKALTRYLKSSQ